MGDRIAAVREWWDRWERVLAVMVAALIVLGLGLVATGVVPFGDPAQPAWPPAGAEPARPSAEPARPSAEPARPSAEPARPSAEPARPSAERPTSMPTPAVREPLAVQPGGPAVGSPADDRVVHAFGPVPVGSTSQPLVLVVTNPLAYPVEVRAVATRSASFMVRDDACTTTVLKPRTTCRLTVLFVPTSAGGAQSPVDVRLRQVCTSSAYWPCNAGKSQIRTGVPDGARTVLPSGKVAVDWTTALNDGLNSLWVEGTTG